MKGCATSHRLKWRPFPPNEVGRIAQHVRKGEGKDGGQGQCEKVRFNSAHKKHCIELTGVISHQFIISLLLKSSIYFVHIIPRCFILLETEVYYCNGRKTQISPLAEYMHTMRYYITHCCLLLMGAINEMIVC